MQIQWYPGHMTKARRAMQEDVKLVDLVIEITDARLPLSGRNPDIDRLGANKYRMILLNKADLADERATDAWIAWFRRQGIRAVRMDARSKNGMKQIQDAILEVCQEKIERDRKRGIKNRPVRAMVAGIPNVGKSTFINSFAGKACTKTGNKPGVTRGNQWIRMNQQVELLDTPGILWPRFEDPQVGLRLAYVGSVNDEVIELQELAMGLISCLGEKYPRAVSMRYELSASEENADRPGLSEEKPEYVLEAIAQARSCRKKGQEWDLEKAARLFLEDFRAGRLGKLTLEWPPREPKEEPLEKRVSD